MKFIFIFNSRKKIIVDDKFEYLKKYKWRIGVCPYPRTTINGKRWLIHRLIMKAKKGEIIDHINHDVLDNRKENLRKATLLQNWNYNSIKIKKKCYSSYKGVTYEKDRKKHWKAACGHEGKYIFIGRYNTEKEAALAYDKKIKELRNVFANVNIKKGDLNAI